MEQFSPPITAIALQAIVGITWAWSPGGRRPDDMIAKRYRRCILATCCVPWKEDFSFAEDIFRRQVRRLISGGIRDLYIFGTAGEGYAVSDRQFDEITRAFLGETRGRDVQAMVGVISVSLATVIERVERARAMGARLFQLSLPSWGALRDSELDVFFQETCGRFPDCGFLHYNLPRAQRLITPAEYGRLAGRHPNFVATKHSTSDTRQLRCLLAEAPQLQHFITEAGFADAATMGECGLLISVMNTNLEVGHAYFDASLRRDEIVLAQIKSEATELVAGLLKLADSEAHMDGAFDKMFCRVNDPRFPLRLLPPYASVSEATCERFIAMLRTRFPRWSPSPENRP